MRSSWGRPRDPTGARPRASRSRSGGDATRARSGAGGVTDLPRPEIAVVVFPGSNDDRDMQLALERLGATATRIWHAEDELPKATAAVVLPGGFSYGDYLRCGAIARFS